MSEHRPYVVLKADVFPDDHAVMADQNANDPVAIAQAAWSDIRDWVATGYQPVVEVVTEDGSFDVDLEKESSA
jgi:hypothetical protein